MKNTNSLQTTVSTIIDFPRDGNSCMGTADIHQDIVNLRDLKRKIKALVMAEKSLKARVQGYMGDSQKLIDVDGTLAATWTYNKDSIKVDAELLEEKYPQIYADVLKTVAGSRVFLVK